MSKVIIDKKDESIILVESFNKDEIDAQLFLFKDIEAAYTMIERQGSKIYLYVVFNLNSKDVEGVITLKISASTECPTFDFETIKKIADILNFRNQKEEKKIIDLDFEFYGKSNCEQRKTFLIY